MAATKHRDPHDATFRALAHPVRREIIDHLFAHPGATVGAVAAQFECSRIAVMKHLRVLEDARLVLSRKKGRERLLHFNPVPLHEISDLWRTRYASVWSNRLLDLKSRLEGLAEPGAGADSFTRPDSPNRPRPADSLPEEPS